MAKGAAQAVENGIDPELLVERVLEALAAKETYIFTHPKYRFVTDERSARVAKAFDGAAESPSVGGVAEAPMALGFVDA